MFVLFIVSDILLHFLSDLYTQYLYNTLCDRKHIKKITQHVVDIVQEKGYAQHTIL